MTSASSRTLRFGRTTSWDQGWMGKQNATDIFIGAENVGAIRGSANTATSGAMNYGVAFRGKSFDALSLADAKARVRKQFTESASVNTKGE